MVEIDAEPLHLAVTIKNWNPDLYPHGIYGRHHPRDVRSEDHDYIRSRLTSKHSQFRLNNQYLFFSLHNYYIRSLNGGIFHMLNFVDPKNNFTASNFKLEKFQLRLILARYFHESEVLKLFRKFHEMICNVWRTNIGRVCGLLH